MSEADAFFVGMGEAQRGFPPLCPFSYDGMKNAYFKGHEAGWDGPVTRKDGRPMMGSIRLGNYRRTG